MRTQRLLASRIVDNLGEPVDVLDEQGAPAPLDNPNSGQAVELSRDGFPVGADPACDLDMGRCRHDARALAVLASDCSLA